MRDRVVALEEVAARVDELARLRAEEICLLAPAREPGFWRAFLVARGRVAQRAIPRGAPGRLEIGAGLAAVASQDVSLAPEDTEELLVVAGFLRRPPPELRIVGLRVSEILAA